MRVIKNGLIINTLKLVGGSTFNYLIPILMTPVLTRLYTPSDYSLWGVFSSIVSILGVIVCGGFEVALVKVQNEIEKDALIKICIFFTFIISFGGLTIFSVLYSLEFVDSYLLLIPLYLLLYGCRQILLNLANNKAEYIAIVNGTIISGLAQALSRFFLGVYRIINSGLILGVIIGCLLSVLYLTKVFFSDIVRGIKLTSRKKLFYILKKYKDFPIYDLPSSLLLYCTNSFPILILSFAENPEIVGFYTLIQQLLLVPMALIGGNLGMVYYKDISSNRDSDYIIGKTEIVLIIGFILGVSMMLFFLLDGSTLLSIILGEKWSNIGKYALFMSYWAFTTIIFAPLRAVYRIYNKQRYQTKIMVAFWLTQSLYLIVSIYVKCDVAIVVFVSSLLSAIFKLIDGIIILWISKIKLNGKLFLLLIIFLLLSMIWFYQCLNLLFR